MADNVTTLVYRGKLMYAKVLGEPGLNYNKDGHEWKFDFIPNDPKSAAKELKSLGVADRLRTSEDSDGNPRYDGQEYMTFKQNAIKKDGSPNQPIRVVNINNQAWDENTMIGNETVADVKFVVIDNGKGRFNGVYPRSIRVLDLVPYTKQEFEPIDEEDEYFKKAQQAENDIALLGGNRAAKNNDSTEDFEDDDLSVLGEA